MPLKFLDDPGPSLGMVRDQPSWLLPPGALFDSLNLVYDQPGLARQRMGSTALVSGSQTAFATSLGFVYAADDTPIQELLAVNGKDGKVYRISQTTGASTDLGTSGWSVPTDTTFGRPVRHFGFLAFPGMGALSGGYFRSVIAAGCATNTTFSNANNVTLAAGNTTVTFSGADTTTNIRAGQFFRSGDGVRVYYGRVTAVLSGTTLSVWPAPTISMTSAAAGTVAKTWYQAMSSVCATSFQNRLLWGNTWVEDASVLRVLYDRRFVYSVLPTESTLTAGAFTLQGALFAENQGAPIGYPPLNYVDIPGSDPILAMEPVNYNQLLIFTRTRPVLFSGNLTTQLATTSPTITFDLSEIPGNASCISDFSVQRTPKGVMWAGYGGIYAWNGREPIDLTDKKINTFWRGKVRGSSFAVHGAAYVRGHYILSYTSGGTTEALACNLANLTWTRMSGVGTDNFYGVPLPTDPSQVFAIRWWDQTGAAPSMTNGQTLRLESMMAPYVSGAATTDADGTAVTLSATTRTITGDPELQKMFQRATVRYQQSSTTAAVAVTAQSKIDAADISATSVRAIGSLSNTSVLTVTAATNANPIAITTSANHGLQSDDFVDIDGLTINTNGNGRWRIVVTGATTFTLVGGIGNGAGGGSPTCKKVTESGFLISPLNAGQGVSYKFDGAPNNFELHGTRTAVLQKEPVMPA